jgi:hypothetical protein
MSSLILLSCDRRGGSYVLINHPLGDAAAAVRARPLGPVRDKKDSEGGEHATMVVVVGLWYANNTYYLYQICNTHPFLSMPIAAASRPEAPSEGDRD